MLKDLTKYEALDALGISIWQPRTSRHPTLIEQDTAIIAEPLVINARCAVILFNPQPSSQKILDGMLSVLQLSSIELMLVKIYSKNADLQLVGDKLEQWNPQTILQLTMDIPAVANTRAVVQTFSPEYLMANVQYKPQAYKDLLTLRKILDHGTSRRIA